MARTIFACAVLAMIALSATATASPLAFSVSLPGKQLRPWDCSLRSAKPPRFEMAGFPKLAFRFGGNADASANQREEAKNRLLSLISTSKRTKPTPEVKNEIFRVMQDLERLNTCDAPVESDLISGKWSLLYTGAAEEDIATRREKEGAVGSLVTEMTGSSDGVETVAEAELPLGRRITTFANSFVENKGNFQDIDAARSYVENRAAFAVGGVPVELKIEGRCSRVKEEEKRGVRLDVFFEKVVLRVGQRALLGVPLTALNEGRGPVGWVETTYLDESMRLGRGDKGSFFVTVRRPDAD